MFLNRVFAKANLGTLHANSTRLFNSSNKVRVIRSHSNSIYWNLATEEYLFENDQLDCPTLFLYREDKTIIIGRHQNPWKECFLQEMEKDNVVLCRRKSGGGAVYQDLGNTCYSFLTPMNIETNAEKVREQNNTILTNALKELGIEAQTSGRNDLTVRDKKISGSAFKLNLGKTDGTGKKYLHHGTMLINVDLDALQRYLNPNKLKLLSKGISSVRSRVENMVNINHKLNHELLCDSIIREFTDYHRGHADAIKNYTEEDMKQIPEIQRIYEELTSWEWLYQKSPDFTNEMETRFDWGVFDVQVQVKGGVIVDGKIYSDCLHPDFIDEANNIIQNDKLTYDDKGVKEMCRKLREKYSSNVAYEGYIDNIEVWLPTVL